MTIAGTTTDTRPPPSETGPPQSSPKAIHSSPSLGTSFGAPAPYRPTLRANPFPEVTDLFCRLPLPTLFYRLEAVHLGDLMRL